MIHVNVVFRAIIVIVLSAFSSVEYYRRTFNIAKEENIIFLVIKE